MKRKFGLLFIILLLAFFVMQVPVKADMGDTEETTETQQETGQDKYIIVNGSDCDVVILREYQEGDSDSKGEFGNAEDNRMQYIPFDGLAHNIIEERRSYERIEGENLSLLEALADCELDGEYATIGDIPEETILSVEERDNMVVITYIIPDERQERVTSRNIIVDSTVVIDQVSSFTLRREIEFAYGIPFNGAHGAQIMSAKAYVSYVNSSSAYYPDTSSIATTIGNMGNPAICTTTVNVYIKSSNQLHGRYASEAYCYGDGDWK